LIKPLVWLETLSVRFRMQMDGSLFGVAASLRGKKKKNSTQLRRTPLPLQQRVKVAKF